MAQTIEWDLAVLRALRGQLERETARAESDSVVAAGRLSRALTVRLESLIGTAGAAALEKRALQVTCRFHPWLREALLREADSEALAAAGALQGQGSLDEAALALLLNYVGLLLSFIGQGLTVEVLSQIWPEVAPSLRGIKESL